MEAMAVEVDTSAGVVRAAAAAAGQEHVFRFMDRGMLSEEEQRVLLKDLSTIEFARVNELYEATMEADRAAGEVTDMEPFPEENVARFGEATEEQKREWEEATYAAVNRGEVGLILLAGGQGTRLGFDRPKGEYNLQLPSDRTLFALQAARIHRVRALAGRAGGRAEDDLPSIPWYVMTSPMTDADTRTYFEEQGFFGLPRDDVFFFEQGTLPCLTLEGKIILDTKSSVSRAPDGNGGIYLGLHRSGALANMEARGVRYLHTYCVDNAVVKMPDPHFIGFCIVSGADLGAKACYKASPDEKVGVICRRSGRPAVVEYTEVRDDVAALRGDDGRLVYGAGNICIHFYTREFLSDTCAPERLPKSYHVARKKIPFADEETGATVKPDDITGMKMESFIFDTFPAAKHMVVFEVVRGEEFSPVKNAPGCATDSPDTARALLQDLHASWLRAAGATLAGDGAVEVSPLASVFGEGLESLSGVELQTPALVVGSGEALPPGESGAAEEAGAGVTRTQVTRGGTTYNVYRFH